MVEGRQVAPSRARRRAAAHDGLKTWSDLMIGFPKHNTRLSRAWLVAWAGLWSDFHMYLAMRSKFDWHLMEIWPYTFVM